MDCGECTLCCKLLEIKAMDSPKGEWCRGCVPGGGCKIYPTRPEGCREYSCSWRLTPGASPNLRPDRIKAIFEPINEHIMLCTHDPSSEIKPATKKQIEAFIEEGNSVVIAYLNGSRPEIALAEGHTADQVWVEALKRYGEYLNGAAELHN